MSSPGHGDEFMLGLRVQALAEYIEHMTQVVYKAADEDSAETLQPEVYRHCVKVASSAMSHSFQGVGGSDPVARSARKLGGIHHRAAHGLARALAHHDPIGTLNPFDEPSLAQCYRAEHQYLQYISVRAARQAQGQAEVALTKAFLVASDAVSAIRARIVGEWDHPALVAFGSLSTDTQSDCLAITDGALAELGAAGVKGQRGSIDLVHDEDENGPRFGP